MAALLDHRFSTVISNDVLSSGDQHRLRVFRYLCDHRHGDPGRPRTGQNTSMVVYKLSYNAFRAMDLGSSAAQSVALMVMVPPALVVMLMQRWFVKGLVDTEK